ncbi:MAG TPA: FtsX-like permease family protein [Blastocatellia bacterium]|jgi:ABC-type antimicrobial peptide transport system permease subunit|nr:FtsX-like permease family protein [Blastocatellia bacterium]
MDAVTLVKRNLTHYWRTNLAVILGVATAVAVLAGALLVGDSVRASLRDLALARLGKTDLVITAPGFFRERLADDLQSHDQFAANFNGTCPIIALDAVVTRDENNARAGGVQVYGVDERFWKFHGANIRTPEGNDILISRSLAQELGAKQGDTLILRIEKPSAIPAESLHGRKDDLGRTVRLTMREVLPAASLGEFSLRPQQGAVRAVFIELKKLQKNLEQDGKANVILFAAKNADGRSAHIAAQILKDKFALADLGLRLRALEQQQTISLESDSAVINDTLADAVYRMSNTARLKAAPILTYVANTIRLGAREIPYSLITAIDRQSMPALSGAQDPSVIALNDWAAEDIGAKVNDEVELDYYLWEPEGRLVTKTARFRVAAITPMQGVAADRDLAPDYPGITDTDSLADWDPPFPIDLNRVRPKDEDYWRRYRTTPKAFIPLEAGQKLWGSRYGKLTSMRLTPKDPSDLQGMRDALEKQLRAALDPNQMGLAIQPVKEQGLQASRGATDFGEYFTYFSFFLVISALLLTTLFFRLGVEQRLREVGLLRAIGFSTKQVRALFLREGLALAGLGSVVGLIGAIAYGALMMFGLRTWWVGAVGTTLLGLRVTPQSLLIGALSGIVTALVCVWWTLRSLRESSPRSLLTGSVEDMALSRERGNGSRTASLRARRSSIFNPRSSILVFIFGALGVAFLIAAALKLIGQVGGFFGAGTSLLIAILFFWSSWLRSDKKRTICGQGAWPMARMGFRNATTRPGRSVLCIALIASAAFIIVSVDAFRRDDRAAALDRNSGAGGYPLMAESLLPIIYDLNSQQGRDELNLNDDKLAGAKITRFRLRPGDDASCLNLYQPRNPRILGAPDGFIGESRFVFQSSLAKTGEEKANPWVLLNANPSEGVVPVVADANSLTYILHLNLGEELAVNASNGAPVRLRVVAALADSVFQGELLMSESNFKKLFPDQEGYRFFLIDCAPEKSSEIAAALEDKLSDFGFDAIGTEEKLAGFHQVENTYLSTFQTLGGLGLLLGTLGLATVLLRNVLERRRELALMRAVGYRSSHLSLMVIAENALLLGCGLLTGVLCALLAIIPALVARGGRLSAVSLGLLLLAVLLTGLAASLVAVRAAVRSPLLPSLRME